ncbi:MAG TPA: glycosyltransferase family 2 protein [Clostridia bacterium]|nr:glycosyltransferase family 2 protein [Clostridia bacterium]
MEPIVTILMAAYNGEKYISEQIESIIDQSYSNWKLVIQDDCSTDNTCIVAADYVQKYEGKIILFRRSKPSGSAKKNFFDMLKYSGTDYIMTCDQDDVWLPDKIKITVNKMIELERLNRVNLPILIHTDAKVVDSELKVLADSLFAYQKLDNRRDKLNNLLVQNEITGCTMMINRALLEKVKCIPEKAIMHDWWFALLASALGRIGYINEPTVLYRQHDENEVGAKNVDSFKYIINRIFSGSSIQSALSDTYLQAKDFVDTFREQLSEKQLEVIDAYLSLPNVNKIKRIYKISKYDFWKSGKARRMGQIIFA